jgi:hypothetical protein
MIAPPTLRERDCYITSFVEACRTFCPDSTLDEWNTYTLEERDSLIKIRYYRSVWAFKRDFLPSLLARKMKPSYRLKELAEQYAKLCREVATCMPSSLNKREAQVGFWLLAVECVEPKHHDAIMKFYNEIH